MPMEKEVGDKVRWVHQFAGGPSDRVIGQKYLGLRCVYTVTRVTPAMEHTDPYIQIRGLNRVYFNATQFKVHRKMNKGTSK